MRELSKWKKVQIMIIIKWRQQESHNKVADVEVAVADAATAAAAVAKVTKARELAAYPARLR